MSLWDVISNAKIQPNSSGSRDELLTFFDNFKLVLNKSVRFRTTTTLKASKRRRALLMIFPYIHALPICLKDLDKRLRRSPSERG